MRSQSEGRVMRQQSAYGIVSPVLLTLQLALPSLSHLSQHVLEGSREDAGGGGGGTCLCSIQKTINPLEANSLAM
jgi:hypothetical protein